MGQPRVTRLSAGDTPGGALHEPPGHPPRGSRSEEPKTGRGPVED
ncbi:hypothetical protein [Streptomyces sp. NPDC094447]